MIIWPILYTILLFLGFLIMKDLIPYLKYLSKYKKQGIKFNYIPIIGYPGAIFAPKSKDFYSSLKKLVLETHKNEKIIAFNEYEGTDLVFLLNDLDLVKEFLVKEVEHTIRHDVLKMPAKFGFFEEGGNHALNRRSIFSEFFKPENLKNATPGIYKIITKHLEKLKIENWGEGKILKNSKNMI